ncbi:DUF5828 family protein [Halodesulfurarchaeum sp. HSR-GB]|uniref:DUF5828 family protein n=1 Tax=Halodesulfurarchaeum sp. HSR-GB TaxID=3074077 RepID=UPI00285463DD|nr:DUF5828 family protein [Halodesulfurarchaeum sp. HSR-GB]MDR5656079.1 DUF5828 family protein [Halodesulfurarchaeum sp. HSR-GB]
MEESISGFKQRGTWGEIVEHGERITTALREASATEKYPDAFEEWVEWRPKIHEQIEEDVSAKTADQASVGEGKGEAKGKTADDDLQSAGEHLTESYEKIEENDTDGAVEKWQDTIDYVARAADTASRKALRKVESTVYERVMTQVAPYYFDNDLISANIQRVRSQEEFVFEVNVNDETLKDEVREHLESFEDLDRWHVDTEKATEIAEAVEGVEAPEGTETPDDTSPDSHTT